MHEDLQRSQCRRKWSVLCARSWVGWHGGKSDLDSHKLELILPPVVMVGRCTAGCLFDGLFRTRWAQALMECCKSMQSLSQRTLYLRECDAAGPNRKLMAFEMAHCDDNGEDEGTIYSAGPCEIHGVQHIVEKVAAHHMPTHRAMQACSALMGTGIVFHPGCISRREDPRAPRFPNRL